MKKRKTKDPVRDMLSALHKESRQAEIDAHLRCVSMRPCIKKTKRIYSRKRRKETCFDD